MFTTKCKKCNIHRSYYGNLTWMNCSIHDKLDSRGKCSRCQQNPNHSCCYHSWTNSFIGNILVNLKIRLI